MVNNELITTVKIITRTWQGCKLLFATLEKMTLKIAFDSGILCYNVDSRNKLVGSFYMHVNCKGLIETQTLLKMQKK